jgi:5-methylcytosine-specific restriction endonuclease McrA
MFRKRLMAAQTPLDVELHTVIARARRDRERRGQGFRSRALELFPPVCARCGRDFAGIRLRELTVHHKDHNHDNNPPDGSNWELLCLYCHDNEHARNDVASAYDLPSGAATKASSTYQPFAGLDELLKKPR